MKRPAPYQGALDGEHEVKASPPATTETKTVELIVNPPTPQQTKVRKTLALLGNYFPQIFATLFIAGTGGYIAKEMYDAGPAHVYTYDETVMSKSEFRNQMHSLEGMAPKYGKLYYHGILPEHLTVQQRKTELARLVQSALRGIEKNCDPDVVEEDPDCIAARASAMAAVEEAQEHLRSLPADKK